MRGFCVLARLCYDVKFPCGSSGQVVLFRSDASEKSLKRILHSPRAGWHLIAERLDLSNASFGELLTAVVPRVDPSVFTAYLREGAAEESRGYDCYHQYLESAQRRGLKAASPAVLQWLIREDFYKPAKNRPSTIVSCGNELGLKILIREGYDVNYYDNQRGFSALSYPSRTAKMVDVLLECGAKVELLHGMVPPSVAALRRLLQLRPVETRAKFTGGSILSNCYEPLRYAEVMHDFDYPTPDKKRVKDCLGSIPCALFTFGFMNQRPHVWHYSDLLWRPHMHYAFPQATKDCVETALLCFKRVCPHLPRDMRNLLLVRAFGSGG